MQSNFDRPMNSGQVLKFSLNIHHGGLMKMTEEFNIKNASGKIIILQNLGTGTSYLDYGMTKLPRNFQGYRVKNTDRTAEKLKDGTFKLSDNNDVYSRA